MVMISRNGPQDSGIKRTVRPRSTCSSDSNNFNSSQLLSSTIGGILHPALIPGPQGKRVVTRLFPAPPQLHLGVAHSCQR